MSSPLCRDVFCQHDFVFIDLLVLCSLRLFIGIGGYVPVPVVDIAIYSSVDLDRDPVNRSKLKLHCDMPHRNFTKCTQVVLSHQLT